MERDDSKHIIPDQEDGDEDPFFSLLNLEDKFYHEGYTEGVSDGARAGLLEGRAFGLEKGFEKYLAMGRLHGRAVVWAGRLQRYQKPLPEGSKKLETPPSALTSTGEPTRQGGTPQDPTSLISTPADVLPQTLQTPLPPHPRLEKHILTLYSLTDPSTLSTENTEESVSDFDDRMKRALAKVKVIERIIGGEGGGVVGERRGKGEGEGSIEDVSGLERVRR